MVTNLFRKDDMVCRVCEELGWRVTDALRQNCEAASVQVDGTVS